MKNIGLSIILILGLLTVSYGQKVVKTYEVVCESCETLKLDNLSEFNKKANYSHINSKLIVEKSFEKKDTEIWYSLLNDNDIAIYKNLIRDPKNKLKFVKKYGKIYKVKRTTSKLN